VLRDFTKADREWLEPLLDAIADASGRLARGEHARFLSDVALALKSADEPTGSSAHPAPRRAPASEVEKPQGALARSLRRWLRGGKS
jgi:PTH1 family peptidyl-tRNA hydrolase